MRVDGDKELFEIKKEREQIEKFLVDFLREKRSQS